MQLQKKYLKIVFCFSNSNYTTSNITEPSRNTDIQINNQINTSDYINDVEMENGHLSNGTHLILFSF